MKEKVNDKILIVVLAIVLLFVGIFTVVLVIRDNNSKNSKDSNINSNTLAKEKIDRNYEIKTIDTSSKEERISPNSILVEKTYFKKCDHLVKKTKEMPEELINLTEKEIEKTFSGWQIEKFSKDKVVIYKEDEGNCNQHYVIKENNGVLGIYVTDENGKLVLKENTEIQTQYLPEIDLEKLKNGIEALGDNELNTVLEDYE